MIFFEILKEKNIRKTFSVDTIENNPIKFAFVTEFLNLQLYFCKFYLDLQFISGNLSFLFYKVLTPYFDAQNFCVSGTLWLDYSKFDKNWLFSTFSCLYPFTNNKNTKDI